MDYQVNHAWIQFAEDFLEQQQQQQQQTKLV